MGRGETLTLHQYIEEIVDRDTEDQFTLWLTSNVTGYPKASYSLDDLRDAFNAGRNG